MYSHCIFCLRILGTNDRIEHFHVGTRLAFDASLGRLWVICATCGRWNLTPLEERWEAIEECERLYRGTRLRASTEQIGLAQLPDGLQLIRIGAPERPELAAWRYGRRLVQRWKRNLALAAGINLACLSYLTLQWTGVISSGILLQAAYALWGHLDRRQLVCRLAAADSPTGEPLLLRRRDLPSISLVETPSTDWGLQLQGVEFGPWEQYEGFRVQRPGTLTLVGDPAREVLARSMVVVNRAGASSRRLERTLSLLEQVPGSDDEVLRRVVRHGASPEALFAPPRSRRARRLPLEQVDTTVALALEMLLHERDEQHALAGELYFLERQWQEAEALAAVADPLATPLTIDSALKQLRALRGTPPA